MANIVDIILKAKDDATQTIAGVKKEVDGLGGAATIAKGTMAGILTADVISKVGDFAQKIIGAVVGLDKMREESDQVNAKFLAQVGGTRAAADSMTAMTDAVGNALTKDEKMAAVGQILALGLAKSAEEAAGLVDIAINLGDKSQTTTQRIEGLTQILVTGRTRGLTAYGTSMQEVDEVALRLQASTAGLTVIEAKRQAILSIMNEKLIAYRDAGGEAITATEKLQKAWSDYQDALANNVKLSGIKDDLTNFVGAATINLQLGSSDDLERLTGLEGRLKNLQGQQDELNAKPIKLMAIANQKEIDATLAQIDAVRASIAETDRMAQSSAVATGKIGVTVGGAAESEEEVSALDAALQKLRDKAEQKAVDEEAMRIFKQETEGAVTAVDKLNAAQAKKVATETVIDAGDISVGALEEIATKAQTALDTALKTKGEGKVTSVFDVLMGLDVEEGGKMKASAALEASMGRLAVAAQEAFAQAMSNAPADTNIADMLLNMEANEKGVTPADTAAEKAINTLSAAIGTQVTGKDFVGKMVGYGETVWGYTEQGMINKAKGSTAFQAAIDAMVAASIAGALQ